MKFKIGAVQNPKTGVSVPITVKSAFPNTLRDALIGGGAALFGIVYLAVTAFKKGVKEYDMAEFIALGEAGLLTPGPEDDAAADDSAKAPESES